MCFDNPFRVSLAFQNNKSFIKSNNKVLSKECRKLTFVFFDFTFFQRTLLLLLLLFFVFICLFVFACLFLCLLEYLFVCFSKFKKHILSFLFVFFISSLLIFTSIVPQDCTFFFFIFFNKIKLTQHKISFKYVIHEPTMVLQSKIPLLGLSH